MTQNTQSFLKGMGTGAVFGMTVAAVGSVMMSGNKNGIKKKVGKAVKAVGTIVDEVQSIVK